MLHGHQFMMITMRLKYAKPKHPSITQRTDASALKDPNTGAGLAIANGIKAETINSPTPILWPLQLTSWGNIYQK